MSAPPHPAAAGAGTDSGLLCLVIIARYLGVAADADRLRHELGGGDRHLGEVELLRAARRLGLKARVVRGRWTRLAAAPLPAIAVQRDGSCVVVSRADAATVHVHDPLASRPRALDRAAFEQSWTRRLILVTRRTPGAAAGRPFGFAWFVPVIVKYRTLLGEVLAASLFLQLFALVTPLFTQVVIDKVLVHKGLTTLHVLAAGMLAVALFEALLGGLRTYLFAHTSSRIDVELGATLFGHVLALPLAYFEARRVGDTSARVRELDTIRQFLTGTTVTLVIDLLFTVVFLAVMLGYSSLLTGIVLAALPGYAVLSGAVTPLLRARLHDKFDRGAESQAFLVESITGIQTVKALAVEPEMQRRWEDLLAGHVRASFRAVSLASIAGQVGGLLAKTVTIAILWTGAQAVMREQLSVGELIAFNMLAGRVTGPVLRIVQLWQEFQQAGIAVARLGDLLNAPREPSAPPSRPAPPALAGRVVFEDVTFRYRLDRAEVLRSVSFSVPPGRIVGIVGRSGSGKSTIARLIQRLYVPERGRVLVDGMDVAQLDPAWLRRRVGVVLQESFLFDRSVRENIALGDPGIPMERVVRAAALAGAHEFVMDLPEGYDTRVGEHGCQLSGGQRQRIAIARALVTDPRILILDEATSALDYESEHLIQQNLAQICAGRTVFIVAHRLSTVRPAHRIFVIEAGSLVEEGTHAELIQRGGQYARLYRYQGNPPLPATGAGAGRPPAAAGDQLGGAEPRGAS